MPTDIVYEINNSIKFIKRPERIISLVPSITELLFDLNMGDAVKGITDYCIYPEREIKNKKRIGGPKSIDFDIVDKINPDLIISVKEENSKNQIIELAGKYNVLVLDIVDYKSALQGIKTVGDYCFCKNAASVLVGDIEKSFAENRVNTTKECVYLVWYNPIIVAGANTFINSFMQKAGFKNIVKNSGYPKITVEELKKMNPEFVLLSSEPFDFKDEHKYFFEKNITETNVIFVDGEMFSWYGSRMLKASKYFKKLEKWLY
jgi:ABC-type Fe3+-hydroxamate transport system substrate-binding protein